MANQKPTKKTAPEKGQPKPVEDLSSLMEPTDEDLELLEMTERTIIRDTPDDEETIPLNDLAEENSDNIDTEALAKALDDAEADLDLSEEAEKAETAEKMKPTAKTVKAQKTAIKQKPAATKASPAITDEAEITEEEPDFSGDEEETPASKSPKKGKSAGKKAPATKEKAAGGKTSKSILLLMILVPVVAAVAMTAAFFIFRQPGKPGGATPQPVARSVAQPQPAAPATQPVQSAQPRQTTAPRPIQGATAGPRAVVLEPPVIYQSTPGQPAGQAKPMPAAQRPAQTAQTPPPRVTTPQQVATPPVTAPAILTETPPADKNKIHTLHGINFKTTADGLQMEILTDNPTGQYTYFPLENPNRLVIDLAGKWHQPPFQEKRVPTGLISRVRLGNHEDKLRIVADVKAKQTLVPAFTTSPKGIVMSIANP